ncbi:hypothetical protein RT90_12090 [Serratia marcescens]|nr:hypothetical protein RT90_12090 [Serratia marcescens]
MYRLLSIKSETKMEGGWKEFQAETAGLFEVIAREGFECWFFFLFSLLGCLISYFNAVMAGALLTG